MVEDVELTEQELRDRAETLARTRLGVSAAEAFERLDRGELNGTILESKLSMLRFLLDDDARPAPSPPSERSAR